MEFFPKSEVTQMIKFGLFAVSLLFIVRVVNSPPEDKLIVSPMFYQTSNLFILYCLLPLFIVDSVHWQILYAGKLLCVDSHINKHCRNFC